MPVLPGLGFVPEPNEKASAAKFKLLPMKGPTGLRQISAGLPSIKAGNEQLVREAHMPVPQAPAAIKPLAVPKGPAIGSFAPPSVQAGNRALTQEWRGRQAKAEAALPKPKEHIGIPLLGSIDVTPLVRGFHSAVNAEAAVITGKPLFSSHGFLGKVANEAVDLPSQWAQGLVGGAKALVEAKLGNPHPLEKIGGDTLHTIEHPIQSLKENPVSTAALLLGGEGAAGKLMGGAMRLGKLGDTLAKAASTEGPTTPIYNGLEMHRTYSPDVIRKGGQVAADKFREAISKAHPLLSQDAKINRHVYGGGLLGQWLGSKGVPVQGFFKPGLVDHAASAVENVKRMYSNGASAMASHINPKHGIEEAVPLALEGTIRSAKLAVEDLHGRLAELKKAAEGMTGKELGHNADKQLQIEKLLANKRFLANPQAAIDAAHHASVWQEPLVERKVQLGHLEPDQLNARLVPGAIRHMKATYNAEPGNHPLVGALQATRRATNTTEKALARARSEAANAAAPHPRVPSDHPVALARNGLRAAEKAQAFAEGRTTDLHGPGGPSPRLLNPVDLGSAKAAYAKAKSDLLVEKTAKVDATKDRLRDIKAARLKAAEDLARLKASGAIKGDGTMWPRLERNGVPLHPEKIEAHMAQTMGDRKVGFLTHREKNWAQVGHSLSGVARPGIERTTRTGENYRNGAYDSSWEALRRQMRDDATTVASHEGRDEIVRRFGIGSYADQHAAERAADNFNHSPQGQQLYPKMGRMIAVQVGPDRVTMRGNMPVNAVGSAIHDFGVVEHKATQELGPEGKWRLMPEDVAHRLDQHFKLREASASKRALQKFTGAWRKTNLFTSTRWPVGTTQENMIRLAAANVNPLAAFGLGPAFRTGTSVVDYLRSVAADPSRTEQERFIANSHVAAIDAGMHYGSQFYNNVNRSKIALDPESAAAMRAADSTTPVTQMVKGWEGWQKFVGNGLIRMERNTKTALLGKQAFKEAHTFTKEWRGLMERQDDVIRSYANSKLDPSSAVKLTENLFDMAGNWANLTPAVRNAVQTWSPFGLWWLNSMKFVYRTMPWDHPIKTGILAALIRATTTKEEEALPSYEKGGIGVTLPIVGHIVITPAHYSPGGVGVDPVETAAGMLLPQLSDPIMTSLGIDPLTHESEGFGKKLPGATRLLRGLESISESTIPGVRPAETLLRKGGTRDQKSPNPIATKPGTQKGLGQAAIKLLFPLPYQKGKATGGREVRERPVRERRIRERPPVRERKARERRG